MSGRDLDAVSSLGEPNRRALYAYVAAQDSWVGREEAADAVGIQRNLAAHHLDRLVDDGLLEADYRRLTGRAGPGAGRPAKVYRRATVQFDVSLPPRRYDLAARVLADATDEARRTGVPIDRAVASAAAATGRMMAQSAGTGGSRRRQREVALAELEARGYEPVNDTRTGTVVLRNCPFHDLAREHTELVCGMNLALLESFLDGLGDTGLEARLDPKDGRCCVTFVRG